MSCNNTIIFGTIYTQNPKAPWAEAICFNNIRIIYVGDASSCSVYMNDNTKVIRLSGGLVLPGFIDAHVHAQAGALGEFSCNLLNAKNLDEALSEIRNYCQNNKHEEWINGIGWRGEWFEKGIALASLLDAITEVPITIRRSDGHAIWANTSAIKKAGINKPGALDKYSHLIPLSSSGFPIGTFEECSADLFIPFRGVVSPEIRKKAVNRITDLFSEVGITSYHEALARGPAIDGYLDADHVLKASLALWWNPEHGDEQLEEFKGIMKRQSKKMQIKTIKLMLDGVVETKTAYMKDPYCKCHINDSDSCGLNFFKSVENFTRVVELCDREGFQLHIHAIGDKAITTSLNAIESATKKNKNRQRRHNIAHLHVVNPDDLSKFQELDVVANFQPIWSVADNDMVKVITPLLGEERAKWQYPIKTFITNGVKYCFGSDWYVSPYNPLWGIHVAVSHWLNPETGVWRPEERITLEQAIYGYTMGAAYATFSENEIGSLEVGKAADIVILEKNIFEIDPSSIKDVKVDYTFVDGELIYQRKDKI